MKNFPKKPLVTLYKNITHAKEIEPSYSYTLRINIDSGKNLEIELDNKGFPQIIVIIPKKSTWWGNGKKLIKEKIKLPYLIKHKILEILEKNILKTSSTITKNDQILWYAFFIDLIKETKEYEHFA